MIEYIKPIGFVDYAIPIFFNFLVSACFIIYSIYQLSNLPSDRNLAAIKKTIKKKQYITNKLSIRPGMKIIMLTSRYNIIAYGLYVCTYNGYVILRDAYYIPRKQKYFTYMKDSLFVAEPKHLLFYKQ